MTEFCLEDVQHRAKKFEGLNPVTDYLRRAHLPCVEFPDHLFIAYGADAPLHFKEWQDDIRNHSVGGFTLAVFDQEFSDITQQTLHLYAPHARQINGITPKYHTKISRGISDVPESLTVYQSLETFFHYCVRVPKMRVEHMADPASLPEAIRQKEEYSHVPLLVNLVQVKPLGHKDTVFPRGPKHAMHIRNIATKTVHPSRDIPVINIQRSSNLEGVTESYTIATHTLLKQLVHDLLRQSKQKSLRSANDKHAFMSETANQIVADVKSIAERSPQEFIGKNTSHPSIDALHEILFGIKMCAGWLATRHTIK